MTSIVLDVANIAAADFSGDVWGTTVALHFDVCEVLDAADVEGDVTPQPFARWQYRRGAHTAPSLEALAAEYDNDDSDYSYGAIAIANALVNEQLSVAQLIYTGDVLSRYAGILRSAGLDY